MSEVAVSVVIDRTPAELWRYVENIELHVEWMVDAQAIRFVTDHHRGLGTSFECDTRIGPLTTVDVMTITGWELEEEMSVRHHGVVTGEGSFTLRPVGSAATEFSWSETLKFPWWMGGPAGATVAQPVLAAIWRRNLQTLKQRVESL